MAMLKARGLVLAEIESAYGVDPVPLPASNAILVEDPQVKVTGEVLQRNFVRSSISPLPPAIGMKEVDVTFKTELKGSGTANAGGSTGVPEIDPLLQACGFASTLTAETTGGAGDGHIDYSPISSALKSVTLYVYLDGLVHKVTGCVGNAKVNLSAGKYGTVEWTFKGLYQEPTDAAIPSGAVFNSQKPKPVFAANFAIGGYAAVISALTLDLANKIEKLVSVNAAEGVVRFMVSERDGKGEIDPEAVTVGTNNFWSKWKLGTAEALAITVGDTAGAKIDITAPKCVYTGVDWADRSGVRTYKLPFTLAQNAGDDELKLKFY